MMKFIVFLVAFFVTTEAYSALSNVDKQDVIYENTLVNGGFENGKAGWTVNAGTAVLESTEVFRGKQSLKVTLSAVNGSIVTQTNTPTTKVEGTNREAGIWIRTALTNIQVCSMQASTEVQCVNVPATDKWVRVVPTHVGPSSGAIGIRVKSSSSATGDIYLDDANEGVNSNVGNGTLNIQLQTYVPSITATTTAPTKGATTKDVAKYWRNGEFLEWEYEFHQTAATGSNGTGTYKIPLPAGMTIDTTHHPVQSVGSVQEWVGQGVIGDATNFASSTQHLYMFVISSTELGVMVRDGLTTANAVWAAGTPANTTFASDALRFSMKARVKISGWSAGLVVRADQSNYDWTAYTPTFTGFGTVTSPSCYHKRDGPNVFIRCKYTTGTHTATEARVSLPSGLTSSSSIPTLIKVGELGFQTTSAGVGQILSEPSVTYLTYGFQSGANTGLTKINGNTLASTVTHNFDAIVPIQGWTENQSAPMITGIVASSSSSQEKMERIRVQYSAGVPTILSQSGSWVSSITDVGTGDFTLNIASGTFSEAPTCVCTAKYTTPGHGCYINETTAPSATAIRFQMYNDAGTIEDRDSHIICVGPR